MSLDSLLGDSALNADNKTSSNPANPDAVVQAPLKQIKNATINRTFSSSVPCNWDQRVYHTFWPRYLVIHSLYYQNDSTANISYNLHIRELSEDAVAVVVSGTNIFSGPMRIECGLPPGGSLNFYFTDVNKNMVSGLTQGTLSMAYSLESNI